MTTKQKSSIKHSHYLIITKLKKQKQKTKIKRKKGGSHQTFHILYNLHKFGHI